MGDASSALAPGTSVASTLSTASRTDDADAYVRLSVSLPLAADGVITARTSVSVKFLSALCRNENTTSLSVITTGDGADHRKNKGMGET